MSVESLFLDIMAIKRRVVFGVRPFTFGWCFPFENDEPIYINLLFHGHQDPTITYIHECLHLLFPKMPHPQIYALEGKIWNGISSEQRFLLSRKLFNRRYILEEDL